MRGTKLHGKLLRQITEMLRIMKMMNFFMLTTNFFIWPDIKT